MRPLFSTFANSLLLAALLCGAARAGAPPSPADAAYAEGHYDKAFKLYLAAADAGQVKAQYRVGFMYLKGWGVAGDPQRAAAWFQKAADQGHALGQFQIGMLQRMGYGLEKDSAKGAAWIEKAAKQGNAFAEDMYAGLLNAGDGVTKDRTLAVQWFQKAADRGLDAAQYNLGRTWEEGWLSAPDLKTAAKLYRAAAEQGLGPAQAALAKLLADKDPAEAYKWYSLAGREGITIKPEVWDALRKRLTVAQTAKAQARADAFKPHPRLRFADFAAFD